MAGTGTAYPADAAAGSPQYAALQGRNAFSATMAGATTAKPLGGISGVRPGTRTDLITATSSTWTMNSLGCAGYIELESSATNSGYFFAFSGTVTGSVSAAEASARVDLIYIQINDSNTSDGSSGAPRVVMDYQKGTAGAGVPTLSAARAFVIAQINVPATGGGSPTVTWVAPYTVAAGGILPIASTAISAATYPGQYIDDPTQGLMRSNGTAWMPVTPAALTCRVTRSTATPTVSSASYTDLSTTANWLTTTPAAQNVGFAAFSNGITIPSTGVYRIGYGIIEQANIGLLLGITVNKSASVGFADLHAPLAVNPVGTVAAAAASTTIHLAAGDVLRLFGLAASGTPALVASVGEFYAEWLRGD